MSDFAIPSLAQQAAILHTFVDRSSFSLDAAQAIVEALADVREPEFVSALRQRLQLQRVKLGHMQASQLAAKLRGRRGLNDRQLPPAFGFQFAAVGYAGTEGKFSRFNDAARAFVDNVTAFVSTQRQPFTATLIRNAQAVMCTFGELMQPGYAIALLMLSDETQVHDWVNGVPTFLEALRRAVEEAGSPGVLVGYACARYGTVGHKNCGEVEIWRGGLRVAVGHELEAYSALLERWAPEQVCNAVADGSSIRIGEESLYVVFALRETEPVLRVSNYISQHPVTVSLLKRAQRFAKRDDLRAMVRSSASIRYPAGSGLPGSIVMNDKALARLLAEKGLSRVELATKLEFNEEELVDPVPVGLFVKVASFFEIDDYNELVGNIPRDAWVEAGTSEVLQGLLDATDQVRFTLSSELPHEDLAVINEAAEDLVAARWALDQNRAGVVEGLDGAVHSVDAEEFLDQLHDVKCIIRAGVKPFFMPGPDYDDPALGKRLVVAVRPVKQHAAS